MEIGYLGQKNTPSLKIYFEVELNYPLTFSQSSILEPNESNYCIRYKYIH